MLYAYGDNPIAVRLAGTRSWQLLLAHLRAVRHVRGDRRAAAGRAHQRRRPRAGDLLPAALGRGRGDRRDLDLRRPRQLLGHDLRRADPHRAGLVPDAARRRASRCARSSTARSSWRWPRCTHESHRRPDVLQNIRAAVVGTGFIGVVHVEALRRLGVEVLGRGRLLARARAGEGQDGRAPGAVRLLRGDARRRARRRRAPHLAQPGAPPAGEGGAGGRASTWCARSRWRWPRAETAELLALAQRERARARRQLQHPLLPAGDRGARARQAGELGPRAPGHRRLPAGLAAARHRLELAAGPGRGRRAARGRRHRLALDRPAAVRHRPPRRGRDGRPRDRDPRAPRADRPGGDVLRAATPASAWTARSTTEDTGRDPAAPRRRRPRAVRGLPAQRRPPQRGARGRSTAARGSVAWSGERPEELWLGHRERPERDAAARPDAACRRRPPPPRCSRPATPRASPTRSASCYRAVYRAVEAGAARRSSPTTRRSPTATTRR